MSEPIVAGKRVCKLMLVEVNSDEAVSKGKAKQSNKFYNMFEQDDATFIVQFGRVDSSCQQKIYPVEKWDKTIKAKTNPKKGYKDVTHLFEEENTSSDDGEQNVVDIQDRVIKRLMDELQSFASNSVKANYNVSSRAVTQAMIDEAQKAVSALVGELKVGADVKEVNDQLLHLYHIIPRKMQNVQSHLFTSLSNKKEVTVAQKLVEDEQATLDVMAGQVMINASEDDAKDVKDDKQDILSMLGLEMCEGNASDNKIVKKLMGPNANQFKKCFKVKNLATQKKYDANLSSADNKKEELFWHGSRNQNWLNIISTGLLIRPAGAIHTGSMFGDGIYFADKAQKSIGYTSLRGSYWASGGDNKAYLALFSVHVGEQKDIHRHDSSCYKLDRGKLIKEGKDSVFAHGGADLRNNEYIVYEANQCTVTYLIEIGS